MLFIAIDNQSDVKGFKMEIAEVEEAAQAVCHGTCPKDGMQGQASIGQTKTSCALTEEEFYIGLQATKTGSRSGTVHRFS